MSRSEGVRAFRRGLETQQSGRAREAIDWYQQAVRHDPSLAPAHFNLAQLVREQGEIPRAAAHFARAAELRPDAADAWLNLGAMEERLGKFAEAILSYSRAIATGPADPKGHFNLGNARLAAGDWSGAATAYRQAIAIDPNGADAQWNLAMALLGEGRLDEGWAQYEWRWRKQRLDPRSRADAPLWEGQPLAGKRLVVWREQGLGDELLFATCLSDLIRRGASVTLVATPRLVTLLRRAFPDVDVVPDGGAGKLPGPVGPAPADYHVPLGSLPRWLRPSLESFPTSGAYLVPDRTRSEKWRSRLVSLPAGPRIGICWRSGLLTEERRRHYSSLTDWAPLFGERAYQWINLQYDDCERELAEAERQFGIRIYRWPGEDLRDDLESVVALMGHLDAVVTAPTVVSAFAGALGLPTWQPNLGGDWSVFGRIESPWFPTVRVISHLAPGSWSDTLARVAVELRVRAVPGPASPAAGLPGDSRPLVSL